MEKLYCLSYRAAVLCQLNVETHYFVDVHGDAILYSCTSRYSTVLIYSEVWYCVDVHGEVVLGLQFYSDTHRDWLKMREES
jgi:hypothetical protein